jgi:predicted lipoprotein with Yx(FWY)xxD motif
MMRSAKAARPARDGTRSRARLAAVTVLAAGLAVAAAGCGGSAKPAASSQSSVTVDARSLGGMGTVLVEPSGQALYMFTKDSHQHVTCTGLCAATWPPLKLSSGEHIVAGSGVKSGLLSSAADPAGGRVVSYDGWPLYSYDGDQPGQANGQALNLNGGFWYLIRPSGQPLNPGSNT